MINDYSSNFTDWEQKYLIIGKPRVYFYNMQWKFPLIMASKHEFIWQTKVLYLLRIQTKQANWSCTLSYTGAKSAKFA